MPRWLVGLIVLTVIIAIAYLWGTIQERLAKKTDADEVAPQSPTTSRRGR